MNQTFCGLNYWAWLGFIFLILAGVCSAKATKSTTQVLINNVKVGIDEATDKVLHPLIDVYSFIVKEHNLINNELLGEVKLYCGIFQAIDARKKGIDIIENGEKASTDQLYSVVHNVNGRITNLYNKYNPSVNSLEILIKNTNNNNLYDLFKDYKSVIIDIIELKNKIEEPNFNYNILFNKIELASRKHSELIEKIFLEKSKVLNKVQQNNKLK